MYKLNIDKLKYLKFCIFFYLELKRLRGSDINLINQELEVMDQEAKSQSETRSIVSVLMDRTLLLPLILVCVLQGGQQLSGINAVFYYSVSIFEKAGLSSTNAKWANLGAGCLNLFIAFFSPILMAKINRRPLIVLSCFISGIFLTLLMFVVHFIVSYLKKCTIFFFVQYLKVNNLI